MMIMTII